jgi:arabinose-5-phosphate isomerase
MKVKEIAKEIFELESKSIFGLCDFLTEDFGSTIHAIFDTKGKFIISGMGKSDLVGRMLTILLSRIDF